MKNKLILASFILLLSVAAASAYQYDYSQSYNADYWGSHYDAHSKYDNGAYRSEYAQTQNMYRSYGDSWRTTSYESDYERYDDMYYRYGSDSQRRYYYHQSTTYSDYYSNPGNRYSDYYTRSGPRRTSDRYYSYDNGCSRGYAYCW